MKYNIMKNRNLILSVLLWAVCSSVFAVTLPSSSYNSYSIYDLGSEEYTISTGTSFLNTSLLSSYNSGTCQVDKQNPNAMQLCQECCVGAVLSKGGSESDYLLCINDCMGASLPLGTPLMLLPFIAVYAVLRRRKQA